ncbi:disease resistance protein TAO1-like isoform X2 [Eucalyptus grandis]|uniref:disease resistance protein TAO1-like isoform X2 n=1 Tax=Eucalyptus grandis TaxID=71139 RepID=UPI00192ED1F4|nr:disease resistance protein TAO1-like isoform X2 [Eucalyptus grandis]
MTMGCWVENVRSLLSTGLDEVRMIGIWGAGGIGKSAIAKVVYNSITSQFGGRGLLANVRETSSKPDDLVHLQKALLSEILWKKNIVVFSADGGFNLIRDRLCCRKILLVLDNVEHGDQLNVLARECEWFGKGSTIIIMTRDKHVLTSHGIDQVCEVKALIKVKLLKVLVNMLFQDKRKKNKQGDIIDSILGYANDLPLAIVVPGPFLCHRIKREWDTVGLTC